MIIRELVTVLGFDVQDSALGKMDKKVDQSKQGLNDLTAAADEAAENLKAAIGTITKAFIGLSIVSAGLTASILGIVFSSANAADEIAKTAPLLGFTIEEFQKYQYAAKLAGIENENFASSTQFLLRSIGEAIDGNEAAMASFSRIGIDPGQLVNMETSEVLRLVSSRLAGIENPATRAAISMDLFGRSGARMGEFLSKGTDELDKFLLEMEAFGVFSAESTAAAEGLKDALDRLLYVFGAIRNAFSVKLFPVFQKMIDETREWFMINREIIKMKMDRFVEVLTTVMTKLWDVTKSAVGIFGEIVRRLGGLESALKLFALTIVAPIMALLGPLVLAGKAFIFVTIPLLRFAFVAKIVAIALIPLLPLFQLMLSTLTAMAGLKVAAWLIRLAGGFKVLAAAIALPLLKLVAISAAIAALILIIEDFYYWMTGGDSVVGEFLGPFEALKNKFIDFFKPFLEQFEKVKAAFKALAKIIFDMFPPGVQQAIRDLLEFTKSTFSKTIKAVASDPLSYAPGGSNDPITNGSLAKWIGDAIRGIFSGGVISGGGAGGAPGYIPAFAMPGGGSGGPMMVDRSIHIDMAVPHGTTESQADYLRRTMYQVAEEVVDRETNDVVQNNPGRNK